MYEPLVSIVTPSFNQGEFIEETINSVLNQNYTNIEYIIMDGGSTDNTVSIIKNYEDHLKWVSEPDKGQSDAINKGWNIASGEIFAWLNSDDVYTPGAVEAAVKKLVEHPEAGMVYGNAYKIDIKGNQIGTRRSPDAGIRWIHWFGSLPQPTTFFRASVLNRVGFLDPHLHYAMDHDLFLRIASVSDLIYLPRFQALMRFYVGTKTSQNIQANWDEKLLVLRRYQSYWLFSWLWIRYLWFRFGRLLPPSIIKAGRAIRKTPTDKIYLDRVPQDTNHS